MWREAAGSLGILPGEENQRWTERFVHEGRDLLSRPHPALVIGGLMALGLGLLACYYVANDVRRYLRMRSM
jgi:hypothetical protein